MISLTEEIQQNRENFLLGNWNYVPINPLGKFSEWFPGTMRGDVSCLTGIASASKSALMRELVEHSAIPWAINSKKNLHIIKFGLEESKRQYEFALLSYRLFIKHKIEYNIKDFLAVGRTVKEEDLPKIKECEKDVERMMKYITYEDSTYNSFGIWKKVRTLAQSRGKFFKDKKEVTNLDGGWDHYQPNDPNEFVIVVVDNLSYIDKQENEKDKHAGIWNTVENLRRFAAIKLNYIVWFVQHQDSSSDNQEARKDKTILPTMGGLAINKEVSRSYLNMIGVANPNIANNSGVEFNIRNWDGHDLKTWGNYLRTINIMKSRWGVTNVNTTVFNAGRCGYFSEMPILNTLEYKSFIDNLKNFK